MFHIFNLFFVFSLWTFVVYVMHRLAHSFSFLHYFHKDHHEQVTSQKIKGLHWTNCFLFFDNWKSTIDQWITEIIPAIIISYIFDQYILFFAYYIWAAFVQEFVEHNSKINFFPWLTSGKWHLIHHEYETKNFGVITWVWDRLFKTYAHI